MGGGWGSLCWDERPGSTPPPPPLVCAQIPIVDPSTTQPNDVTFLVLITKLVFRKWPKRADENLGPAKLLLWPAALGGEGLVGECLFCAELLWRGVTPGNERGSPCRRRGGKSTFSFLAPPVDSESTVGFYVGGLCVKRLCNSERSSLVN